jgi:hypothetical protein
VTSHIETLEPRTLLAAPNPTVVDLMVLYTPSAKADAGGQQIIVDRIRRAVANMNLILSNSTVNVTVRLVHQEQVDYDDTRDNIHVHGLRLDLPNDGYLDEVPSLAARFGADVVSLWIGLEAASGPAGISGQPLVTDDPATLQGLFSNVLIGFVANSPDYVFAHEMGHTLGAGHDRVDDQDNAYVYAYGQIFKLNGTLFGDLMTGSVQEHIPYYSNPDVRFRGIPTGIADREDNARAMRLLSPYVADNAPTAIEDVSPPSATLGPVFLARRGRALRFHVYLADDTAIDVSTLSSGDFRVSSSGVTAAARLVRIDNPTAGAQRTAVYEVSLPRRATSPEGFTFNVQAGEVRDTAGLAVPAGALAAPNSTFADRAGPSYGSAYELGDFTAGSVRIADSVGGRYYSDSDIDNYYRFTLKKAAYLTATMAGLPGHGNVQVITDPHVPGGHEGSPLAISNSAGKNVQKLSIKLPRGSYFLITEAQKYRRYMLTMTTSRRPAKSPPVSLSAPLAPAAISPEYRALNFRPFHATMLLNSSEDPLKAADENQDVLNSVWL